LKSYKLYSLVLLLAFIACSKKQHVAKSSIPDSYDERVRAGNQKNFDDAFYEGNKQLVLGNHNDAITQFKKCVTVNQKSDVALYLLAKEYYATRQYSFSLSYAEQAVKLNDKNIWYQVLVSDNLKLTGKSLEAAKLLEHIADKFPSSATYYFNATESYIVVQKYNDALRCLDKLEKFSGVNEDISFKKVDLFLKLNKKDPAITELQKLITAFPLRHRYKVAMAELYYDFNEEQKAMELLKQVLAIDPDMPDVHLLLANIYRRKGENEKSFDELKIVFSNPDADMKQELEIISSYIPMIGHNASSEEQALELGFLLTKTHPEDDACDIVYADILYTSERYTDAEIYYLKALEKNKANFNLWQNMIECEDQLKKYDDAKKHADEALDAFPNQTIFYYFKAYFAYKLKDYTAAAITAKNGIDIGSDKPQLLLQLYSIMGDANNELKNYAASDEAFEKLLMLDPNNLQTLNNYSYYLSLRKEKLDKAEAMSKKSLDIDPNNASYLDTYGWILYQEKKYADAKMFIEKAVLQHPNDAILNEHLGDVYFQLNETENAMRFWKKAQENGSKSTTLGQKIISKKLID
jgi:tetratricopeptide (TPR) repeat protein